MNTQINSLKEGAQAFSEYMTFRLIRDMYPQPDESSPQRSNAQNIFNQMLLEEYAKHLSHDDCFGVKKSIMSNFKENLLELQEVS